MGIPERQKKKKGAESLRNNTDLGKELDKQFMKLWEHLITSMQKDFPKHILLSLSKVDDKEGILKTTRVKWLVDCQPTKETH